MATKAMVFYSLSVDMTCTWIAGGVGHNMLGCVELRVLDRQTTSLRLPDLVHQDPGRAAVSMPAQHLLESI